MSQIEVKIPARNKDLGGFSVHRVLPYGPHRMVGPFIFFDHMGPAEFPADRGINVRPHPHINLATVTYLFDGRIRHRDSLGSDMIIEPGAINWMVAGSGVVHSERTPDEELLKPRRLHGIQLWVALPQELEESPASFNHYPKEAFTEFQIEGVKLKVLLGKAFRRESPVTVPSDLFYVEAQMSKGQRLKFPAEGRESALYIVEGSVKAEGEDFSEFCMLVSHDHADLEIEANENTRVMFLGGVSVGPRFIDWNFVSSSKERIEAAKKDWSRGPQASGGRFLKIPGDDQEYIPLPETTL